jgi:xanthine dehydrogenase accessory factor
MRDILPDLEKWIDSGEQIALATVIQTWGSSPRGVGAKMALTPDGKITGSVSGGCVEGAVFETGVEVLKSGKPELLHFGVADETAWEVGLACGGQIDVFVEPLDRALFDAWRAELLAERAHAMATVIRGPGRLLGRQVLVAEDKPSKDAQGTGFDQVILEKAHSAMTEGRSQRFEIPLEGEDTVEVFVEVGSAPPTLVMVGGVHIAVALTSIAKALGYRTVVVDPRRSFGSPERFPHVDQLIQAWPQEAFEQINLTRQTALAMLTHDPKIDDPALKIALDSPAFYIGALGSRKTQGKRRQRLLDAGCTEAQLGRLHGPIGLDIGAETPEEIALAVMAEVVAARHEQAAEAGSGAEPGGSGRPVDQ